MLVYINKEYVAARNLIRARGIADGKHIVSLDVINIISANRLIEGGAAMFAAAIINQINDIAGNIIFMPLFRIRLREVEHSYVMLVDAKREELRSP